MSATDESTGIRLSATETTVRDVIDLVERSLNFTINIMTYLAAGFFFIWFGLRLNHTTGADKIALIASIAILGATILLMTLKFLLDSTRDAVTNQLRGKLIAMNVVTLAILACAFGYLLAVLSN